tara:strand:- start:102 stop:806 length:705 start_codon:yes stop_codon:yes gene_type:complete
MKINRKKFPTEDNKKRIVKDSLETRLFVGGKLPITGRSFTNYSIQLFPDIDTSKLLSYLKNKDLLDFACGVNHQYPESLLCKLGKGKKRHGLDIHNESETTNHVQYFKESAFKTKFPDNSYDCITINNFMYLWITKASELISLFKELTRISKPGCEIRIFPIYFGNYSLDTIELFTYINTHFTIQSLFPQIDYSKESPICIKKGGIVQLPPSNGIAEYRENHKLMAMCILLRKL